MTLPKKVEVQADAFNRFTKRMNQTNKIINHPELLEIVNEIAAKPATERENFAKTYLSSESLSKRGIELPLGTEISFKGLAEKGASLPRRKRVTVTLTLPEVGYLTIYSLLAEGV